MPCHRKSRPLELGSRMSTDKSMQVLLTVETTAGVSGDQCLREADLLRRLGARLYDYVQLRDDDFADRLLQEASDMADEWQRLGELCKKRESQEQVNV